MITPRTTTSKRYPKFIRENKFVKKYAKQKRIFPKLGLKNCSKKLGKNRIVFSSEGNQALWDIATMSMRGISSCQRWSSNLKTHLIGSMIDPCVGIIYITSGKDTKYGTRMMKRALVRFVVDKYTAKPALLLERVYPHDRNKPLSQASTYRLFIDFLKKKTKNKIPVLDYDEYSWCNYSIPFTTPTLELSEFEEDNDSYNNDGLLSYRDSGIEYITSHKYK